MAKDVKVRTRRKAASTTDEPVGDDMSKNPLERGELGALITQAGKVHGPNVIRSAELMPRFRHIPTNIFPLDMALHGGVPEGAISLIYGWEASGKTTLSTRIIAAAQKKYPDQAAVFIDLEGTYSPAWGAAHGIDNSRMVVVQPDGGEQALDLARGVIKSKETSIVVVDSLAALVPIKEQQKAMEDATVGEQGKMIARFCRVIQNDMIQERKRAHRPAILLINQFRMKIGVMFGDPRTLPGGLAQHYAASTKIEIKNKEVMGKDAAGRQTVDHNIHSFNLKKSKIGTGVREGEFKMVRNQDHWAGAGFVDDANTIITWARAAGHITGGGSSWRIAGVDTKFGRLSDMADYLYSDTEFAAGFKDMLIKEYRQQCGLIPEYL